MNSLEFFTVIFIINSVWLILSLDEFLTVTSVFKGTKF